MKDQKKVQKNLLVGLVGQIVAVLLGIILPKQILDHFGSEVNGLLSSVTNIYAYIAIVEAGVAAASCQALYKPVSEGNYDRANAVIAAMHHNYRKVGCVYIGLIFLFSTIYPLLIQTELSFGAVSLIILFNGIGNAVNFFFHGKYLILLKADGKQYIHSGLEMSILFLKQIAKIAMINAGFDVVVVQSVAMVVSIVQMLWITYYINKNYAWINLKKDPDFEAISQSKHVFAHEVNYLITNNLDVMLLTVFSNLKVISVYALYSMLYGMISRVLYTIRNAIEFKIAYEYHRSRKAFLELFEIYEVCYITLATALISIASYFILPFLRQYTAGVTDINYIDVRLLPLFALIYLFSAGRYPFDAMIHIAGHYRQTKGSAIAETVVNLVVSVVLVQVWGICGVLLGTIVSSLFRTVYLAEYVNRHIIGRSRKTTYLCWGINLILLVAFGCLSPMATIQLDSYGKIFMYCIPYSIVTVVIFFGVNSLYKPCLLRMFFSIVRRLLH